jgi:hypothetical protein
MRDATTNMFFLDVPEVAMQPALQIRSSRFVLWMLRIGARRYIPRIFPMNFDTR